MARSLLVHWVKGDASPSTDVSPASWLVHEGLQNGKAHAVEWSGRRVMAKCDVTVKARAGGQREVDLDYEKHKQNKDILLGVMRLVLKPSELRDTEVHWKVKGGQDFENARGEVTIEVSEPVASDKVEPPKRVKFTTSRIIRDTSIAMDVKALHNYDGQICGDAILLPGGSRYAEAHHTQPLGAGHKGPDIRENIQCVCPNHHAELDLGARRIQLQELLRANEHQVAERYIDYHNKNLFLAE